jgi:hypothetical protein
VYIVEFRVGATDAIVGVAASRGAESLDQAFALARQQLARLNGATPSPTP